MYYRLLTKRQVGVVVCVDDCRGRQAGRVIIISDKYG